LLRRNSSKLRKREIVVRHQINVQAENCALMMVLARRYVSQIAIVKGASVVFYAHFFLMDIAMRLRLNLKGYAAPDALRVRCNAGISVARRRPSAVLGVMEVQHAVPRICSAIVENALPYVRLIKNFAAYLFLISLLAVLQKWTAALAQWAAVVYHLTIIAARMEALVFLNSGAFNFHPGGMGAIDRVPRYILQDSGQL
jgi:hypothetical protein